MVALAQAFGWTYGDIVETPYYVLLGCLQVLVEKHEQEAGINSSEWDEWQQHGKEWVMAQWPKTK